MNRTPRSESTQSPRKMPGPTGSESIQRKHLGTLFGYRIVNFVSNKYAKEIYKDELAAYKKEVEQWIDSNFDESVRQKIKDSDKIKELIGDFKYISDRRVTKINENINAINKEFENYGVHKDDAIKNNILAQIDSKILSGEKTIGAPDLKSINQKLEGIIQFSNEGKIIGLLNEYNIPTERQEAIKEKFPEVASGKKNLTEDIKQSIIDEVITPLVTKEMDEVREKVKDQVTINNFEEYRKNEENKDLPIKEVRDSYMRDIGAQVRSKLREQIRSINSSPNESPWEQNLSKLKERFPSDEKTQNLPSSLHDIKDVDKLLDTQKVLKKVEKEAIQEKAEKDYKKAVSTLVKNNAKYGITKSSFPEFREIIRNNKTVLNLFEELENATSAQDHQAKLINLNAELEKLIKANTSDLLEKQLPLMPAYKKELREELMRSEEVIAYNELVATAEGRSLEYVKFNDIATIALGNGRVYDDNDTDSFNPFNTPLTKEDITNIKKEIALQTIALQKAVAHKKEADESLLLDTKEAITGTAGQFAKEAEKTLQATASALSVAAKEALAYFGLNSIPVDENIKNQYNEALEKAKKQGITSALDKAGKKQEFRSIEDQWALASKRYNGLTEDQMQKRFNARIKALTQLLNQELKKTKPSVRSTTTASASPLAQPQPTIARQTQPQIKISSQVEENYPKLLEEAGKANVRAEPNIKSLWTAMDQYYLGTIPDRDERRKKLLSNIKILSDLTNANIMAAKAAKAKTESAWGMMTNLFSPEKIEVPIPEDLKVRYNAALVNAKNHEVEGCADLETLWTYTMDILYAGYDQNLEQKRESFIKGILNPTIQWMEDMANIKK